MELQQLILSSRTCITYGHIFLGPIYCFLTTTHIAIIYLRCGTNLILLDCMFLQLQYSSCKAFNVIPKKLKLSFDMLF